MKARIPGQRALLKPDKRAVRDYVDQHQKDVTRWLLKLACVSLHLEFGFEITKHYAKIFGEKEGAKP